ncbi:MAG TPA: PilZ domain-containing protein [Pyrinomonadaceae bacterium]|nr:PilZ domain-containing protein [Pyrinomonadaceae bacterium]HLE64248.1 PilZ domain-containing protein [Pyrinomonadaceae bacterium]
MLTGNNVGVERRKKPRVCNPFSVVVRSVNAEGEAFTSETVVDNLSAGGMYVRIPELVSKGTRVFSVLQFPVAATGHPTGSRVALKGVALRSDEGLRLCGLAVTFTRHRFL